MFSDEITCQNLILCLIPHDLASPTAIQETIIWILMNFTELEKTTKIDNLFTWIASEYFPRLHVAYFSSGDALSKNSHLAAFTVS